jgi:putative hydrolase of the HAD superfamily
MKTPDLSAVQCVSFDAGGTLILPYPSVGSIYAEVLNEHGRKADPTALELLFKDEFLKMREAEKLVSEKAEKEFWRRLVFSVLNRHLGPGRYDEIFEAMFQTFALPKRWKLMPGAVEAVEALHSINIRTVILSNADSRFHRVLNGLGIGDLMERIFISSEIGAEKPDPAIFRHVESELGLLPDQLLHLGDSLLHDVHGASSAGWHAVLFSPETNGDFATLDDLRSIAGLIGR